MEQPLPKSIGRYEVKGRLGRGGMAVVYRGQDLRIGRPVAIKVLYVDDEDLRDRFLQEARAAGNLDHRSIVRIYDVGEDTGGPYIVMEFIDGVTLADHIAANHELSLPRKLDLFLELLDGLEYAHNTGLIHRDVKPQNIMLQRNGALKILDFGIARLGNSTLTLSGTMLGTPNYMSPEQIEGRTVDRRSDVFAAGLVLYELLSYRQAFSGDTAHQVLNAIARSRPTPLREVCPGIDTGLEIIVDKAIHKDPARRYQTMAAMAADLRRLRGRFDQKTASSVGSNSTATIVKPVPTPLPGLGARTPPPGARTPIPAAGTPPPGSRTPLPDANRELRTKRRAEAIERALGDAQQAFDRGDIQAAIDAGEQAALIDPDEPRVIDLLDRAHAALDRQRIAVLLDSARVALEAADFGSARETVARALEIDATYSDTLALQVAVQAAERREERRREAIAAALARARESLAHGHFESAIRAAGEILQQDPTHADGHELTREALRGLEERRQREAREKAARDLVVAQRNEFARGRRLEAIAALEAYAPPHEIVTVALDAMRAEHAEIERIAAEEEARRVREAREAEERRIQAEREAEERRQREAREAEEKRQREAREAEERRQAQIRWAADHMAAARAAVTSGRYGEGFEILAELEREMPGVEGAAALREEAVAAQAAAEAEAQLERERAELLARGSSHLAAGRLESARELAESVLRDAPAHDDALALLHGVDAAIAARERQETLDRAAQEAAAQARALFDAGSLAEAIAALDGFPSPHPLIARTRGEFQTHIDALAREAERARLVRVVADALEHAQESLFLDDLEAAAAALDEVDRVQSGNARSRELRRLVDARTEQMVREARERERAAQPQWDEPLQDAQSPEELIEQAMSAEPIQGVALLKQFLADYPGDREATDLLFSRVAEVISEAQELVAAGRYDDASKMLDDMEALGVAPDVVAVLRAQTEEAVATAPPSQTDEGLVTSYEELSDADPYSDEFGAEAAEGDGAYDAIDAEPEEESPETFDGDTRPVEWDAPLPHDVPPPVATVARSSPLIWGGAAAAAAVAFGVGAWLLFGPRAAPAGPTDSGQPETASIETTSVQTTSVLSTTTVPGTSTAPSSALSSVTPTTAAATAATSNDPNVVSMNARRLLNEGRLENAVSMSAAAMLSSPGNPALMGVIADALAAAEQRMTAARAAADAAGATSRTQYRAAMTRVDLAMTARRAVRADLASSSLADYLEAARLFDEAARAQSTPAVVTAGIDRTAATTTAPASTPAPPTVPPTNSVAATTTASLASAQPATPAQPDSATITRLLASYIAALNTMDSAQVAVVYPRISDADRRRVDNLRQTFSRCTHAVSGVTDISPADGSEWRVRASFTETCRPRDGGQPSTVTSVEQVHLRRNQTGAWTIWDVTP
jgi:serine/threonine-protein kinase